MKNKTNKSKANKPFSVRFREFKDSFRLAKKTPNGTVVNIKGIIYTCIELSMVSVFIDLVFFSGLSKSLYELFGVWYIAAAVPLSLMAIGFGLSKFFVAQRIGAVKELKVRLKDYTKKEHRKLTMYLVKWFAIHTFLIGLSVFTSTSLSLNSIGSGITRNANTLKQIDTFIEQGTRYSELVNTANSTQLSAIIKKSADTSQDQSIAYVTSQMAQIRPAVESYKSERAEFEASFPDGKIDWSSDWKGQNADTYWTNKNNQINSLLTSAGYKNQTGPQIMKLNLSDVESTLRSKYLSTYQNTNSDEVKTAMEEVKGNTLEEAEGWLASLNSVGFTKTVRQTYVDDSGREKFKWITVPVQFDTDPSKSTKVLVDTALTQLKAFRVDVENDSGDIGSSSKIFMIVGNAIDADGKKTAKDVEAALEIKVSTGMGATEKFMMLFIAICGIVQEILISMFTPEAQITRRLLGSCKSYLEEFDINRFLIYVYGKYDDLGLLSAEEAYELSKESVRKILRGNVEDVVTTLTPIVLADMEKERKGTRSIAPANRLAKAVISKPEVTEKQVEEVTEQEIKTVQENKPDIRSADVQIPTAPKPTDKEAVDIDIVTTEKPKPVNTFSSKVDDAINEIEELLKE